MPPPAAVRVRVPASAANLGPGFDSLGLALALHDVVAVRPSPGGLSVEISGEGAAELPRDEENLVVRALRAALAEHGMPPLGLAVRCRREIPLARGLGSSAAAVVAGVLAGAALAGTPLERPAGRRRPSTRNEPNARVREDALALAARLDGHADNVAACLFGGATAAWVDRAGRPHALPVPVHPALRPVAFVPGATMPTGTARGLLPDRIPFDDAVRTVGRAAALVVALGDRPDVLVGVTDDDVHEPHRLPAHPPSAQLLAGLRSAGIAAVLAGSGPAVLALADGPRQATQAATFAGRDWAVRHLRVDRTGATVRLRTPGGKR